MNAALQQSQYQAVACSAAKQPHRASSAQAPHLGGQVLVACSVEAIAAEGYMGM
jgi:hypothetical protein